MTTLPAPNTRSSARISPREVVRSGLCLGCGSCAAQAAAAGVPASMKLNWYGQLNPAGPPDWYRQPSAALAQTCPFSPRAADENQLAAALYPDAAHRDPQIGRFQTAYVGYAAEGSFRDWGSSGGMVSWVAAELLRLGLVDGVAHVVATDDPQARAGSSATASRAAWSRC